MKKLTSVALAFALVLSLGTAALADAATLSDVSEGQWFYEPVSEMIAAGYIDGYEDGTFKPERDVSVAEFVTMTAKCLGLETGEEYGHWAGRQMGNAYAELYEPLVGVRLGIRGGAPGYLSKEIASGELFIVFVEFEHLTPRNAYILSSPS